MASIIAKPHKGLCPKIALLAYRGGRLDLRSELIIRACRMARRACGDFAQRFTDFWQLMRRIIIARPGPILGCIHDLSLEGVSQTDSIPPGRLLTLVRPGNDLVLRRIRNPKCCAQACGCYITAPRYACSLPPGCISSKPTFAGLQKTKKGSQQKGSRKKGKGVSFGKA